jgi:hypothetical protein
LGETDGPGLDHRTGERRTRRKRVEDRSRPSERVGQVHVLLVDVERHPSLGRHTVLAVDAPDQPDVDQVVDRTVDRRPRDAESLDQGRLAGRLVAEALQNVCALSDGLPERRPREVVVSHVGSRRRPRPGDGYISPFDEPFTP